MGNKFERLIGKVLAGVTKAVGGESLTLEFLDGTYETFHVYGGCCSSSWIEHVEEPADIRGATITGYDSLDGEEIKHPDHECLQVYQTRFLTDRGPVVVEYRNSSNGFYGGWLE